MTWQLEDALRLIRQMQPGCMQHGYYVALAGGVLNEGSSEQDLDLVLVPMTLNATPQRIVWHLATEFGDPTTIGKVPGGEHYGFMYGYQLVELLIVTQRPQVQACEPLTGGFVGFPPVLISKIGIGKNPYQDFFFVHGAMADPTSPTGLRDVWLCQDGSWTQREDAPQNRLPCDCEYLLKLPPEDKMHPTYEALPAGDPRVQAALNAGKPTTKVIYKNSTARSEEVIQRQGFPTVVVPYRQGQGREVHVHVESEGVTIRLMHKNHQESERSIHYDRDQDYKALEFHQEIKDRFNFQLVVPHSLADRFETWVHGGGNYQSSWYREGEVIWTAKCEVANEVFAVLEFSRRGHLHDLVMGMTLKTPITPSEDKTLAVADLVPSRFLGDYSHLHEGVLYTVKVVQGKAPSAAEARLAEMRLIRAQATFESESRGEGMDGIMLDRGFYQMIEDLL